MLFRSIADDAQMEGRTSAVDHDAIVAAAGTLRRIANRLSSITSARVLIQMPPLDPVTELARERFFLAIREQLTSWLIFFGGAECFSVSAARVVAQKISALELSKTLNAFTSLLQEEGVARLA